MNTKRSYLDTLNAGRQRKPLSTLDQLNQSLQALEQQIGRTRDAPAEPRYPGSQPYSQRPAEQPRQYQQARGAAQPAQRFDQSYQAIARDMMSQYGWGDGQLESEIEEGSWLTTPATPLDIFASPDVMWKSVAARIGLEILMPQKLTRHVPPNPEMN